MPAAQQQENAIGNPPDLTLLAPPFATISMLRRELFSPIPERCFLDVDSPALLALGFNDQGA